MVTLLHNNTPWTMSNEYLHAYILSIHAMLGIERAERVERVEKKSNYNCQSDDLTHSHSHSHSHYIT
jgi:hypothetical protein